MKKYIISSSLLFIFSFSCFSAGDVDLGECVLTLGPGGYEIICGDVIHGGGGTNEVASILDNCEEIKSNLLEHANFSIELSTFYDTIDYIRTDVDSLNDSTNFPSLKDTINDNLDSLMLIGDDFAV